jgi:hypothetical protein
MSKDLYRQDTPEQAAMVAINYIALMQRYGVNPAPPNLLYVLRKTGYTLHRLPRPKK